MRPDEQGYSGARLIRLNCTFSDGRTGSYICQYAKRSERIIMQILTEQKRGHSPLAYSDLRDSKKNAWFIMQDIQSEEPIPCSISAWKKQAAAALADIHADNLGLAERQPFLPRADADYWKQITTKISVDHFEKACALDSAFAAEYSGTLRKLQKLAERFAADMAGLYQDGTSVTLTHGELQDISGDHVRCFNGAPMLIDWGFGRLAPFYIDLVDFFPPEETWLY